MNIDKLQTVHFSGIGGSGMSALARLLLKMGYMVSGSDISDNSFIQELRQLGATVFIKQTASNLNNAHILITSTAIKADNPEVKAAKEKSIPIYHRADCLSWIMDQFKTSIAVTGTHGKTTTSSLLARAYSFTEKQPSFAIGSVLNDFNVNAMLGDSDLFIAEADESDGSFLCLHPTHAIISNLEEDHMDYFKSFESLMDHFHRFVDDVTKRGGKLFLNADDKNLITVSKKANSDNIEWFGIDSPAKYQARSTLFSTEGSAFNFFVNGKMLARIQLKLYGTHHVYNALSVAALMHSEGISVDIIKEGLEAFSGVKRRFEFIGEHDGIQVYDDYGHHPTEIITTLEGIKKSSGKRLICIFQPHRYSRTHYLLDKFTKVFDSADTVIITDIYSAQEQNIFGVSSESLVNNLKDHKHPNVSYIEDKDSISSYLAPKLSDGDLVVTMGAGDVHQVSKTLLNELNR
ncbi:UDP-N-acetylmuramate--L-alanine ligase [Candidatus Marinamargulisbacteria bacterium SCGC AAA071-K20]|nr:UDP-N-acetylmuramate--L-alanine ligase [Candidatus Marinamargulisbacteria bacterium SCGC AAA071-K20]